MVKTQIGNHPSLNTYRTLGKVLVLALVVSTGPSNQVGGQDTESSAVEQSEPLTTDQQQVAGRYKKLEELLLRSAELESAENPARSALLQQAAQLGKQSQLADLLARAATRLDKKQYSQALEDQRTSRENLKRLLELLQSENRGERVREQRDQVRRWIEETDRLLRLQKSLSGRTEGGQELQQASGDQNKLSNKAKEIAKELGGEKDGKEQKSSGDPESKGDSNSKGEKSAGDASEKTDQKSGENFEDGKSEKEAGKENAPNDEADKKPAEKETDPDSKSKKPSESGKPSEGAEEGDKSKDGEKSSDSKDGKPKDGKPGDSQKKDPGNKDSDGKPSESPSQESDPAESEPAEPGKPQEGKEGQPQQGQSQQGKSDEQQKQQEPKDPTERAKKRIEQAQRKMEEAKKSLDDAERKGAVEKQREAESELRSAIEALEEILRQLREEEIERSLASLETRLRRMLEMQNKVLEETLRLQEITGEQASRQIEIRASNLAGQERKILDEGRRAFLLLREEGSSTAFPEAMEQVNTDIGNVAERLAKADIGKLTTTVEQEIVSSLEEMVAALAQVQKEQKEKKQKQQQGQPQQGEPGEQPLVDKLAELRLIRTLQIRINNRTTSLSQMLADPADLVGQAKEADILKEVKGLADRQSSIQHVTREIVVGADK